MTPQEIGLVVLLVVIAGYVIAALFSRSKSGEEPADIMLEARLPKAAASRDALKPDAGAASPKNSRRPRRKSATAVDSEVKETSGTVRTQRHHASPKPAANADPKTAPEKKAPPLTATATATATVRSVVDAPAPVPKAEPEPEEVIDPELTGQISELDDRLDAIEKLVASIEESLASFEILEESQAGEAQAA